MFEPDSTALLAKDNRAETEVSARRAASSRAGLLGAALRAMRDAPPSAHVLPHQLAAITAEYEAACRESDALFVHASWCSDKNLAAHNCVGEVAPYVEGAHGLLGDDELPSASAVAWSREEDGLQTICLHLIQSERDREAESWFSPAGARELAAQLLAAAAVVEGETRVADAREAAVATGADLFAAAVAGTLSPAEFRAELGTVLDAYEAVRDHSEVAR